MSITFAQVPNNPQNNGTYLGIAMFVLSCVALIGPPIDGALVTRYGTFDQAANLSGVVILTGDVLVLFSKRWTEYGVWSRFE